MWTKDGLLFIQSEGAQPVTPNSAVRGRIRHLWTKQDDIASDRRSAQRRGRENLFLSPLTASERSRGEDCRSAPLFLPLCAALLGGEERARSEFSAKAYSTVQSSRIFSHHPRKLGCSVQAGKHDQATVAGWLSGGAGRSPRGRQWSRLVVCAALLPPGGERGEEEKLDRWGLGVTKRGLPFGIWRKSTISSMKWGTGFGQLRNTLTKGATKGDLLTVAIALRRLKVTPLGRCT